MTHREAVAYVEGLDVLGVHFGLQRIHALLGALGDPQRGLDAVHVVGSNGKTSTTRFAAAALASQGRRVGAYLSPHVQGWDERIEVDGAPIGARAFTAAVGRVQAAARGIAAAGGETPTQFEVLTAAAFAAFRAAGCDTAVVEAGLGGRYDATNVLDDAVVVLTTVSLEHTEFLGPTHEHIAREKLAVAAPGSRRVVVGRLDGDAHVAVARVVAERGLRPWRLGREVTVRPRRDGLAVRTPNGVVGGLRLGVAGRFQHDNAASAVAAAELLHGGGLRAAPLRRALAAVRIPGRLETVAYDPLVVLDGAHNPAGVAALAGSLRSAVGRRRPVAVMSVLDDKDAAGMLAALAPHLRAVVATRSRHRRAIPAEDVAAAARGLGLAAHAVPDPAAAVAHARRLAGPRGAVLVTGSLYLLADVRPALAVRARTGASARNSPANGEFAV